jgi:hypothetical protein
MTGGSRNFPVYASTAYFKGPTLDTGCSRSRAARGHRALSS